MVLNVSTGMWEQVTPLGVSPAQFVAVPQNPQARARASQPPVSQAPTASSISEEIAEEVLAPQELAAYPTEPVVAEALTELPTKARSSVPILEEEGEMSSPPMVFLSSQDRHYPASESGVSSTTEATTTTVDLSEAEFAPLKQQQSKASDTIEVQNFRVERRVQMRTGPTADSEKVCILNPGQRVHVVKTKTSRTKAGFVTTKAYVLSDHGQGWVSVNRQAKKTDETFVFQGQIREGLKRSLPLAKVWARHEAEVQEITNASNNNTFSVRVSCPTWQKVEALRVDLQKRKNVKGRKLINRRPSQLVNLRRVFGSTAPCAHVYDIDVDAENGHRDFLTSFDWSAQHRGSTTDFAHQVRGDLRQCGFPGARRVEWTTGRTSTGSFAMRDFCTVEFSKDSQLRQFLKHFEKYDFFYGAKVTVDPQYANLATVSANLVKA